MSNDRRSALFGIAGFLAGGPIGTALAADHDRRHQQMRQQMQTHRDALASQMADMMNDSRPRDWSGLQNAIPQPRDFYREALAELDALFPADLTP